MSYLTSVSATYSTSQLSRITGLSVSTLQKWHRQGIAPASVDRSSKGTNLLRYSEDQAITVMVLLNLHRRGIHWRVVRRIAATLEGPWSRYRYLIALETRMFGAHTDAEGMEGMKGLANMALVVETEEIISREGRPRGAPRVDSPALKA